MKHWRFALRLVVESILFAACVSPIIATERPLKGRDVLLFDLGPATSARGDQVVQLSPDSVYTPTVGYGWLNRPHRAFNRSELDQSRTAWTIDGVTGRQLGFRANVNPGMWHVTIWVEATMTENRWPKIIVQGQQRALHWQDFRPNDEPEDALTNVFRVFHCTSKVASEGLFLELVGGGEDVRVLGLSLIRQVSHATPEHQAFLQEVTSAGRYQQQKPLKDLLQRAEAALRENPDDAFFAIWRQRLELLATAESYYSMLGWQWANEQTGLGMYDRQCQAIMLLDGLLTSPPDEAHPLSERALYCRGRLLYWLGKESGGEQEIARGKRDLEALAAKHPDDDLLAMYTGKRIVQPGECDRLAPAAQAPAWSVAQREALCRLRQLVYWWVDQRQSPTGELGGKLGDDVEMLRWWTPLCLAGDEIAIRGWKKLADCVWNSEHISGGYARKVRDVEHAAEFVADTAPMMLLYDDDPVYEQRLVPSAVLFEELWTGKTVKGNRFFRSAWFSSTAVETDGHKGRDLEYNTRAVQAMRYLAWRSPDPKLVDLLHQWSTAWTNAAMRTDKGKPKGIIPASVRFADEAFNGDGPNWYQANTPWDYFEWDFHAGSMMLDQLLFTYTLTKDKQLLQPMFMALELIRSNEQDLAENKIGTPQVGSSAWAAAMLIRNKLFWNVVEQWRFLTDDPCWDDLILNHGTAYGRYRVSGDERHLMEGLDLLLKELRYNTPLKTTEAVHTDRLYVPHVEFLKATLSGDGIYGNLSPYFAVSWQKTDENFTALVRNARANQLEIDLFSHAAKDYEIIMRVWQLEPGNYQLVTESHASDRHQSAVTITERGQRITIEIPSRRLFRIKLVPVPAD